MTQVNNSLTFNQLTTIYQKAAAAEKILSAICGIEVAASDIDYQAVLPIVPIEIDYLMRVSREIMSDAMERMQELRCSKCPQFVEGECVRGESPERCC